MYCSKIYKKYKTIFFQSQGLTVFKKIKSWDSSKEHLYIQSIDNDQFNKILAILENFNLDNATEDASNEIVENRNKIYIDAVKISTDFRKNDKKKQASNKHYDYKPLTNACR